MLAVFFGLTMVSVVLAQNMETEAKLKENDIIPDVIATPWNDTVHVEYKGAQVDYGHELTPTQVQKAPDEVTWNAEKGGFYTVCMVDPDAPSRKEPTLRPILHWMVVNIPGDSVNQGTPLWGYRGSMPAANTGLHRYVFLVYKQPGKLTFDEKVVPVESREGRWNFKLAEFADKYKLGNPVAGNFFQAQSEDNLPPELPDRNDIGEVLKKHAIIPDVIAHAWKEKMEVNYKDTNVKVDMGNELTPTQVNLAPQVSWEADEGSFYVLCMTDPDAPSRKEPKFREFLHWLVVNIPGKSVDQGTALAGYVPSGPPKGTGLHRYVLLAYKQPGKLTFDEKVIPAGVTEGRFKFKVSQFAKKHNVGDPVAGNFFQAQFEEKTTDQPEPNNEIAATLKKHGVIPDVIIYPWRENMHVEYKNNLRVNLGNELTPTQVKSAPDVSWEAEEDSYYVLCMTDPDAPSRKKPEFREFLHWLVVNIPGKSVDRGTALAGYVPSGPPKGTGLHRYVLLVYKQLKTQPFQEEVITDHEMRKNFAIANFANKYMLGDPVAGNFFQSQFEESHGTPQEKTSKSPKMLFDSGLFVLAGVMIHV